MTSTPALQLLLLTPGWEMHLLRWFSAIYCRLPAANLSAIGSGSGRSCRRGRSELGWERALGRWMAVFCPEISVFFTRHLWQRHSAVALVRLVPSGRARTRCGVSGAGLGGLRGCSARCSGHVPGVALVPISSGWDGGHKLCPLEDLGPVPPFVLPGPGDRSGCACSPPLSAALPPQG